MTHKTVRSILIVIFCVTTLLGATHGVTAEAASSNNPQPTKNISANKIITETNNARAEEDLTKLKKDSRLMKAAQEKARDMSKHSYFNHTTPNGRGFEYFIDKTGYTYTAIGENIALHFTSEKEVVKMWLNSPPHRKNILNPVYDHIGVGVSYGTYNGQKGWFGVQIFGSK